MAVAPLAGVLEGTGDGSAWFAAGEDEGTDGHGAKVSASFMDWDADLPQVGAVGISGDLSDCEDFFADGTGGVRGVAVRGAEGVSSLSCDGDKKPEDRAAIADGQEEEWFAEQAERLRRANEKALQQHAHMPMANSSQLVSNS